MARRVCGWSRAIRSAFFRTGNFGPPNIQTLSARRAARNFSCASIGRTGRSRALRRSSPLREMRSSRQAVRTPVISPNSVFSPAGSGASSPVPAIRGRRRRFLPRTTPQSLPRSRRASASENSATPSPALHSPARVSPPPPRVSSPTRGGTANGRRNTNASSRKSSARTPRALRQLRRVPSRSVGGFSKSSPPPQKPPRPSPPTTNSTAHPSSPIAAT